MKVLEKSWKRRATLWVADHSCRKILLMCWSINIHILVIVVLVVIQPLGVNQAQRRRVVLDSANSVVQQPCHTWTPFWVPFLCDAFAMGMHLVSVFSSWKISIFTEFKWKRKTIQFPLKIPRFWAHRCTWSIGKSDLLFHMKVVSIFCRTGRIASLVVRNLWSYWQTDVVLPLFRSSRSSTKSSA